MNLGQPVLSQVLPRTSGKGPLQAAFPSHYSIITEILTSGLADPFFIQHQTPNGRGIDHFNPSPDASSITIITVASCQKHLIKFTINKAKQFTLKYTAYLLPTTAFSLPITKENISSVRIMLSCTDYSIQQPFSGDLG